MNGGPDRLHPAHLERDRVHPGRKDRNHRVWLFSEVNQDPNSAVVTEAVKEFEKAHSGAKVNVHYIPVDARAERSKAAFNGRPG